MKHIKTTFLALLCAFAGMTNFALAADKTVTYTFSAERDNSSNRWTLTFTPSSAGLGYSTGTKTATIQDLTNTTGFSVQLDDGLQLSYRRDAGQMVFVGYNSFWLNRQSDENTYFTLTSTHYYVKHVMLATANGDALYGMAAPWTVSNTQMDTDVDMVTQNDALTFYRSFNAHITATQTFAQLTVTYGEAPRPYAITFNEVEGLTNPNPATYSVTTADFQVTAPTRTGYDLGNVTYTDAAHPSPTAVTLPMTISRGDAVTRKDIAFNAAWTAHTYTLRLHHNDGTDDCTDMAMTYDEAQNIQTVSRTGYIFDGWSTTPDGSVAYSDGQEVLNLTAENGAIIDLYAQWVNPSGTCGTSATWEYDHANTTLTISGSGEMDDYDTDSQPWNDYKAYITKVDISNDITHIGSYAFKGCTALATITGGSGVTSIGPSALDDSRWLNNATRAVAITYLGHVLVRGGKNSDRTMVIADGTTAIYEYAFFFRDHPYSKYYVLATTPPTIGKKAFYTDDVTTHVYFFVRNSAYKTDQGWEDIDKQEGDYQNFHNSSIQIISTLTLPDDVTSDAELQISYAGVYYDVERDVVTLRYTGNVPEGYHVVYSVNGSPISGNTFTMPAEDVTITALTPITYTLRLHHNDGTDAYTDMTLTYDEAQNIQTVSRTGYILDGWSTTQDGSIAYTDGQEVLNLTAENGATIDLYAQWTLITNWSHVNTALKTDGTLVTLPGDITAGDGDSYLLVPSGVTATLDLNGHTINRNLTSYGWEEGSAIRVEGSLTINDSQGGGCITGGYGYYGGGVCVSRNASFTMNGGTISGNTASDNGGGVMVYFDATCTLNGVTLSGNTAFNSGGGVYVDYSSSCSMTDVTITGNTASIDGGGVYAGGGTTFSGLCTITGNTKGGQNNNDYAGSRLYIGGTLDPATRIGISMNRGNQQIVITNGLNGKGSLDNFFCDVEGDQLSLNDDGEAVVTLPPVKVGIYPYSSDLADFRVTDAEGNDCENSGSCYYALSGTTVYVHVTPYDGFGISDVTYEDSWNPTPATFVSAEQREFVYTFVVPYTTDGLHVNANTFWLENYLDIYDNEDNRPTIANYHGRSVYYAFLGYRTLYKDGDWNTLCLPFNVSDLSGTCLEGATLMELGNSSGCNTGFDATTGTLTLDFVPASSIEAGHAYLVKWETTGDPIVTPWFENVTVVDENPESQKVVSQDGSVTFVGSYCPVTFTGGDRSVLYLGSNSNLYFPAADRTMGACRAYFRLNLNAASEVKAFVLNFNEDDATSLNEELRIKNEESAAAREWYTLDGRKLNEKPSKGGIYIHNGRKEILK